MVINPNKEENWLLSGKRASTAGETVCVKENSVTVLLHVVNTTASL